MFKLEGTDDDESSSSSEQTEKGESVEDIITIFALPHKEYHRSSKQMRLEDLNAKQLAVAFSNVTASVSPSEIMQLGGEAVPWQWQLAVSPHFRDVTQSYGLISTALRDIGLVTNSVSSCLTAADM